ncbi:hypothetical protein [Paraliobacillus sp. JSM ZJ581]|uniref:hypothetical protein n=1 Tax=Paraliobacillus sp. JSM ZJ581 TaxID=3342118 RepID=UPI0035A8EAF3
MKKLLFIIVMLLLISACDTNGGDKNKKVSGENNKEVKSEESEDEKNKGSEKEKLSNDGDKMYDPEIDGTVELMGTKEPNETIDLDPVKLRIHTIKVIRMLNVKDPDFLNYIQEFTDKNTIEFVQILYEIENTEDINVRLNSPIRAIVLNTGEQIETFGNDLAYDDNYARTLYGEVKNESAVSIVIKDSDPKDINEIKIITGRIDHGDTAETLVNEQTITYKLD